MIGGNRKKTFGYSDNFFYANEVAEFITGLWRPKSNQPLWVIIPYYTYSIVMFSNGFVYNVCEYLYLKEMLKDIPKLLSYIGMCLTHTLGIIKLSIFVFQHDKLDSIKNRLQHDDFKYASLDENGPSTMFSNEKRFSNYITYWVFVMYGFVGVSAHISAVISLNKALPGNTFEGTNRTCNEFLPYYFLIPFPTKTKNDCILASTFMDLGFATWGWVIACYDGLYMSLLRCYKIQLIIVGHVVRTLRQRCLLKLNLNENTEVMHDEEQPELEQEMYNQLNHTIKHVQLLYGVRDDIEDLVVYVTLIQTLSSLFIFASCLYVASIVPMSSPEFFAQMQFFTCVLIQLSLICWSGNEITVAGESLSRALFESDWFSCSRRFKSSMLITMTRTQRPIILTIGKFTPLTITTLVNVCRGSFSYFAVFKTVK
ncbi:unnamed protein product [Phyllotreta striolata]|uniref:Odorant receptor n=1 Tax=Phyllotreta striolata TaxID=444603 RepID=A0A9N9XL15_PHYSR|nr:unnamed protein product [Phyllotreta striolata]